MPDNLIINEDGNTLDSFGWKPYGYSVWNSTYADDHFVDPFGMYILDPVTGGFYTSTCAGSTKNLKSADNPIGASTDSLYLNIHGHLPETNSGDDWSGDSLLSNCISLFGGVECGSSTNMYGPFSAGRIKYTQHGICQWVSLPATGLTNKQIRVEFDYQMYVKGPTNKVTTGYLCLGLEYYSDDGTGVPTGAYPASALSSEAHICDQLSIAHNNFRPGAQPAGYIYVPDSNPTSAGGLGTATRTFSVTSVPSSGAVDNLFVRLHLFAVATSTSAPESVAKRNFADAGRVFINNLQLYLEYA